MTKSDYRVRHLEEDTIKLIRVYAAQHSMSHAEVIEQAMTVLTRRREVTAGQGGN